MLKNARLQLIISKARMLAIAAALPGVLLATLMVLDVLSAVVLPTPMTVIRHYESDVDTAESVVRLAARLRDEYSGQRIEVFSVAGDQASHGCHGRAWVIELGTYTTVSGFDITMNGPIDRWAREMGLRVCLVGGRTEYPGSIQSGVVRGVLLGVIPFVLVLLWQRRRYSGYSALSDWQPTVTGSKTWLLGLGAGAAIYVMVSLAGGILAWLGGGAPATDAPLPLPESISALWLTFGPAVLVMPLVEEYLFRALLLERTSRVIGDRLALVYAACVFSAVHFPDSVTMAIGLFLAGTGFGLVWLRARSLLACTLAHALFNLLATAAALWLAQPISV